MNGIFLWDLLPRKYGLGSEGIISGRCQSITAGIQLRTYTLSSCSNCGMTVDKEIKEIREFSADTIQFSLISLNSLNSLNSPIP